MRMTGLVLVLCACMDASVWAGALLGPPVAALGNYDFGAGIEYSRLEADYEIETTGLPFSDEVTIDMILAPFMVKATDRWEIFGKIGGSRTEAEDFDGDWGIAGGFGTRVTILEGETLSWGLAAQALVAMSDQDFIFAGDRVAEEILYFDQLIAFGPAWRTDIFMLYGGALVRHSSGEDNLSGGGLDGGVDLESEWDAGGYVGIRLAKPDTTWLSRSQVYLEGQFTNDSTSVAVGLLIPFGKSIPWE